MSDENERVFMDAERVPSGRNDEVEGHRFGHEASRVSEPAEAERAALVEDDGPEVEGHRFGHSPAERVMTDPNRAA